MGHDLRELVPHDTEFGKGGDELRAQMRRRLDIEISDFDPEVIHVHGLGMLGHLALESGAPYVISAFADELLLVQNDSARRKYSQEAVENAGYLIVDADKTRREIETLFGEVQAVAVAAGADESEVEGSLEWLWEVYRQVVARRGGYGS